MSIRCSGLASRSFIIGSRLWPPAMIRASGPSRSSAAIAPSTLVARSYSNGAGVCNRAPLAIRTAWPASACAARRCPRAARTGRARRCRSPASAAASPAPGARTFGYSSARREAAALDVAQHRARPGWRAAIGASRPSRASVSVPLRVDLADPRRRRRPRSRGSRAGPRRRRPGRGPRRGPIASFMPAFLTSRPSSRSTPASRCRVDRVHDAVDRRALLDDLADAARSPRRGPAVILRSCEDRRDEEVDEREHDQQRPRRAKTAADGAHRRLRVVEDHVERAAVVGDARRPSARPAPAS